MVPWNVRLHLAAVVGLYIVGVTWFARNEAGRSDPFHLRAAAAIILAALFCDWPSRSIAATGP